MDKKLIRSFWTIIYIYFVILSCNSFAEKTVNFAVGEWAPFESETMVNYGPTAEIMAIACKKAGYKPEFNFYPWKRAFINVKKGKAVATFPWIWTKERSEEFIYSKTPIMVTKGKFYFLKERFPGGLRISVYEDLKPYKMVGIIGYSYVLPAKKAGINICLVPNTALAWKKLETGLADVLLEDEMVAKADMKKIFGYSMNRFSNTVKPFKTKKMFCLFSKEHPDSFVIMIKLDKALNEMNESGEIERILKRGSN